MTLKKLATSAVALCLVATASNANTITEIFDFAAINADTWYTSDPSFIGDQGGSVTVSADSYTSTIGTDDGQNTDAVVGIWGGSLGGYKGLGMCDYYVHGYCDDASWSVDGFEDDVDYGGAYDGEYLEFSFDQDVTLENIQFYNVGSDNYFDLWSMNSGDLLDLNYGASGSYDTSLDAGSVFAIGAFWESSGFLISSITVSYNSDMSAVPLPASGLLLLGGLGGLTFIRRRKT